MAFLFFDDRIPLRLDQGGVFCGLVVLCLAGLMPFLVFDVFGKPAIVAVPVASVELVDGVGV